MKLRRLFPTASRETLEATFPGRTWNAIRLQGISKGFRRKGPPLQDVGIPLLDDVRQRAYQLGLSMGDLDKLVGAKAYFRGAAWLNGWISHRYICKAAIALGCTLRIKWDDDGISVARRA